MLPELNLKNTVPTRWLTTVSLLVLLPLCAAASTATVDYTFTLGALSGSGEVMFDPTLGTSDSFGSFVNGANGLTEFDLTYDGHTYMAADALDSPAAPEVFLAGNDFNTTIGAGQI